MGSLWSVLPTKYKWSEDSYHVLFGLGVAFTKYHLSLHKLRSDYKDWFNRHHNRQFRIGDEIKRKKCSSNKVSKEEESALERWMQPSVHRRGNFGGRRIIVLQCILFPILLLLLCFRNDVCFH